MRKKYDVFISYDDENQKIVEALSHYLEERHVKCFVTYRDIPRNVDQDSFTMEAIGQSQMMLVVFSGVVKMNESMLHNLEVCTEMGKPVLSYRLMNSALYNQNKDYYMTLNWRVGFPNLDECFGAVFRNILSLIRPELVDYKEVMTNVDACRKNEHLIGLQQKSDGDSDSDFLPETELESDGEPDSDFLPETELESDGEPDSDFLPETVLESDGEPEADFLPETVLESDGEPEADFLPETVLESDGEPEADFLPETVLESDGGPEPDFLPETELESDGEPEPDILPETELESDGEPEPDFLPETELESDGGPEPDFLPETELESDGEPEADILPETVLESDGEPEADFLPETELESDGEPEPDFQKNPEMESEGEPEFVFQQELEMESEGESKLDSQLVNLEDIASLFEMVPVKGGTFLMGAQAVSSMKDNFDNMAYGDEEPVHTVELSDFQISKTVVTQAQWKAVMGDLNVQVQFVGDNLPVDSVSWNVACDFVSELNAKTGLNFGFPTEAQWEFAARGGVLGKCYKYSGGNDLDAVGWNIRNSSETTHPVAQKSPNELGIFDMSGNVWEWCVDDYCEYSKNSQTNPLIKSDGVYHVLRGGSAKNNDLVCRVSSRNAGSSGIVGLIGIRLVLR